MENGAGAAAGSGAGERSFASRGGLFYLLARLPNRLSDWIWSVARIFCRPGRRYFFDICLHGRDLKHGGVVGLATPAFSQNLEQYEPEVSRTVAHLLPQAEKGTILDVGANFGQSLLKFKALCPDAPVHCFEPVTVVKEFLDELVLRNGFKDCRVVHAAVGDGSAPELLIRYGPDMITASALVRPGGRARHDRSEKVAAVTLDDYVAREVPGPIALMKIDVEGYEPEVISGAERTLRQRRPPLILEVLDWHEDTARIERQRRMEAFLRGLGYRFYWISGSGRLTEQDSLVPDPACRYLNYLVKAD